MQEFSALIVWSLYKIWPLLLFLLLLAGLLILFAKPAKRAKLLLLSWIFLTTSTLVLSLFLRPHIVVYLTNRYGIEAQGQVVNIESLNRWHNEIRVKRHHIIYRDQEGKVVETFFDTDDFNIYPWQNRVRYPTLNKTFRLKFLPSRPQYIIIMRELGAEHCEALMGKLAEAKRKLDFDPTNVQYSEQVADYQQQIQAQCVR